MKKKSIVSLMIAVWYLFLSQTGFALENKNTGFLILAPDRGFLGNKETFQLVEKFQEEHIVSLALVGSSYSGVDGEYANYIRKAIGELNERKVLKIVVIPLFLSNSNLLLKKMKDSLPDYKTGKIMIWSPPLAKSYLTAQILLDRVKSISKNPTEERLVVIGLGAMDESSEKNIKKEIQSMIDYVHARKPFQEVQVGVYYNRSANKILRKNKNEAVDDLVIHTAAKKGRTLLVPFFMGPKFSLEMSLTYWLQKKFKEVDLVFQNEEIMPHPNILTWMKKTANEHLEMDRERVGIVVMPHGATQPYNDAVEAIIDPLRKKYPFEMAYGMGDDKTIAMAVHNLESQGVRNIVFVRMYSLARQFKDKTDYILGLKDKLPEISDGEIPSQVRTSARISAFGGYEESPLTSKIIWDRIQEISTSPSQETVIILAHGSKKDEDDQAWRNAISKHIDWIQKNQKVSFKGIYGLTVREDWRDKRNEAIKEIKKLIQIGNKDGRVLLISDRLYGSGPYKTFFEGLSFELNGKGLTNHPNLTQWLDEGIEEVIQNGFLQKKEKAEIAKNPSKGSKPLGKRFSEKG